MWVVEIDIDFVFGPEITWFSVSIEHDFVLCGWSKLALFQCGGCNLT